MTLDDEVLDFRIATYMFFPVIVSGLGAGVWMLGIQYFLFKIHWLRDRPKSPTSLEINFGVTVLWILHLLIDSAFHLIFEIIIRLFSSRESLVDYQSLRYETYKEISWTGVRAPPSTGWEALMLLYHEVLATWLISKVVVYTLETLIPFLYNPPQNLTAHFQTRCLELLYFAQILHQNPPSNPRSRPPLRLGKPRSNPLTKDEMLEPQSVTLIRHQDLNGMRERKGKGERTLSWDLTVGREALDEMKETLGPPGGFGELGFSVGAERVLFAAMGVGTRFELTFELEEKGGRRGGREGKAGVNGNGMGIGGGTVRKGSGLKHEGRKRRVTE